MKRNYIKISQLFGKACVLAMGFVFSTGLAVESHAENREEVPDADAQLTRSELRWCKFEVVRLAGAGNEINRNEEWEVDDYNREIKVYNELCTNKEYLSSDMRTVEGELTGDKQLALQSEGTLRVLEAREERENRRLFVADETASIRLAPEETGPELGQVRRWGELIATGRTQGAWYEVEWKVPSVERALQLGWVLGGLVERGSGTEARFNYCETHAGQRAQHNEIVRGQIDSASSNWLVVNNGTGMDAYVKLVDQYDRLAVSFLVGTVESAKIEGIPLGSYEILFANGSSFSRGCDSFSRPGRATRFAQGIEYHADGQGWEITLHTVRDGNTPGVGMTYDDFDKY